ncbi:MAG: contact-dependent growth inhibition system immunity protein, partial [Pyrinomonadaceae bacterium]
MDDFRRRFPGTYQFLNGYFHQDWKGDYDWRGEPPNFEAVARFYRSQASGGEVTRTAGELRELLALPLSDAEL